MHFGELSEIIERENTVTGLVQPATEQVPGWITSNLIVNEARLFPPPAQPATGTHVVCTLPLIDPMTKRLGEMSTSVVLWPKYGMMKLESEKVMNRSPSMPTGQQPIPTACSYTVPTPLELACTLPFTEFPDDSPVVAVRGTVL